MDFLKWILQACLIIALMFLGMKPDEDNKDSDTQIVLFAAVVNVLS